MKRYHTEYAYAKINPYLAVTSRREDGYHTILSHMQAITLHDTLTFSWEPAACEGRSLSLRCDRESLPCDGTNLICRAAEALFHWLEAQGHAVCGVFDIMLQKQIPVSAGLAGGSADAAATLRGLNAILGTSLSLDILCRIGATLGADIPFCLMSTTYTAMTAQGMGEILTPAVPLPPSCHLVVACHGEGVSTPWAYRSLDEQGGGYAFGRAELQYAAFAAALATEQLDTLAAHSHNCFETVVLPERPQAALLMQLMEQSGACFVRMSGSGPSVVGYFDDAEQANACAQQLREQQIKAFVCRPLTRADHEV